MGSPELMELLMLSSETPLFVFPLCLCLWPCGHKITAKLPCIMIALQVGRKEGQYFFIGEV